MIQKNDPSPAFHKIIQARQRLQIVFMTPRRTYLRSNNTIACSKAEILSLFLKISTSPTLRKNTQA